jgi:hypothetical protein
VAKVTKSAFKKIVKECLVEILSEGLMPELGKKSVRKISESKVTRRREEEEVRLSHHRKKLDRRIEDTVSSITDDSVLRDILSDTAKTTLQEQMDNSGNSLKDNSRSPGIDISQLFSGVEQNWEKLAFKNEETR